MGTLVVSWAFAARRACARSLTALIKAGLSGPRFEPDDDPPLYGTGVVADGRLQKYFGSLKGCPMSREPTTRPFRSIRLPAACPENATFAMPVTSAGYSSPVITVNAESSTSAGRTCSRIFMRDEVRRAGGR